jgi:MoaA/NifB/PqqE/SkfB family radical SAM enzyme
MNFSQYKIDFKEFVNNIRFFYEHRKQCEMIVKINGDLLTEEEKQKFYDIFGDIADGIFIESIMDCWPTFEQKKVTVNESRGIHANEIREVLVCSYVFYSFAINSDGTCSLCFLDWERTLLLGNVEDISVKEIWNGRQLWEYQKLFLEGKRKTHPVCAECGQLRQGAPDDLDRYRKELLEKI